MGCSQSSQKIYVFDEIRHEIQIILNKLNANNFKHYTLGSYTLNCFQNLIWSSHMTNEDRVNLDRLWYICTYYKKYANMNVSEFLIN